MVSDSEHSMDSTFACKAIHRHAMSQLATPPTSPDSIGSASSKDVAKVIPFRSPSAELATPPSTPGDSLSTEKNYNECLIGAPGNPTNIVESWCGDIKIENLIGEGLWSKVFRASRTTTWMTGNSKKTEDCFAVKIARDKFSEKVILAERDMLEYLHAFPGACNFVVPFHGWHKSLRGLVMDEIPLALSDVISGQSCQKGTERVTTRPDLKSLVCDLVDGLSFLHKACMIHGDIKPHNILLRPWRHISQNIRLSECESKWQTGFEVYYCDFSASQYLQPGEDMTKPHDAAGASYDFMAPELFSLREPDCYPSVFSDVYALGITLLSVLLGSSPFDGISTGIMRRALCKEGRVLELAKDRLNPDAGDLAWLVGALERNKENRWRAIEWQEILVAQGWPSRANTAKK